MYRNLKVHISPFNGQIWGDSLANGGSSYLLELSVLSNDTWTPYYPPYFSSDLDVLMVEVGSNATRLLGVPLP